MRRFIFYSVLIGTLVFAAGLMGTFFVNAIDVMNRSSELSLMAARWGAPNPLADLGIAIGVMVAALSVLLLCYRYANRLPMTGKELFRRMEQDEKNALTREAEVEARRVEAERQREEQKKRQRSL